MDAYAQGEIAAMSSLVHPRLAIITAIGPQHMERFGTIDRIADAMYEVVTALPADGTLILYTGDELGTALAQRARTTSSARDPLRARRLTARRSTRTSSRHRSASLRTGRHFAGGGRRRAWTAR